MSPDDPDSKDHVRSVCVCYLSLDETMLYFFCWTTQSVSKIESLVVIEMRSSVLLPRSETLGESILVSLIYFLFYSLNTSHALPIAPM